MKWKCKLFGCLVSDYETGCVNCGAGIYDASFGSISEVRMGAVLTIYAVRRKQCGCLVSVHRCRDQGTPIGTRRDHPDHEYTVAMGVEDAARVSELCRDHAAKLEQKQEGLFDGN